MNKRPTLILATYKVDPKALKEVVAGLEEEGISYRLETRETGSAMDLAAYGASRSGLGLGIGLVGSTGVLAARHLAQPIPLHMTTKVHRMLGHNAGKYIKHQAFIDEEIV